MLTLSLVWGILAIIGMFVAFLPCLGSLNWLNIPFAGVGLVISVVAVAISKEEKKGGGMAGILLCAIAVVIGLLRLMAGGGIL